jgi:hypothetical protein
MAELHVVSALRNKRAELVGTVRQLEQQLAQQVTNLAHLDATMQLFDLDIRPQEIRPKQQRARSAWFRQGEYLRLIYHQLRDAPRPVATRKLAVTDRGHSHHRPKELTPSGQLRCQRRDSRPRPRLESCNQS